MPEAERLPYREDHLKRSDEVGGAAKREALVYWSNRKRACGRFLQRAKMDLLAVRDADADAFQRRKDLAHRIEGWQRECEYAKRRYEECEKLAREAWL